MVPVSMLKVWRKVQILSPLCKTNTFLEPNIKYNFVVTQLTPQTANSNINNVAPVPTIRYVMVAIEVFGNMEIRIDFFRM